MSFITKPVTAVASHFIPGMDARLPFADKDIKARHVTLGIIEISKLLLIAGLAGGLTYLFLRPGAFNLPKLSPVTDFIAKNSDAFKLAAAGTALLGGGLLGLYANKAVYDHKNIKRKFIEEREKLYAALGPSEQPSSSPLKGILSQFVIGMDTRTVGKSKVAQRVALSIVNLAKLALLATCVGGLAYLFVRPSALSSFHRLSHMTDFITQHAKAFKWAALGTTLAGAVIAGGMLSGWAHAHGRVKNKKPPSLILDSENSI